MRLKLREIGRGEPLFFLHGLFGSGDNWTFIARKLEDRYRCILPDLRNHGESPWSAAFSYRDMASDLLETADSLGLESVRILGHSLGGKAAMTCALLAPERVTGLVVADMAPRAYQGKTLLGLIGLMLNLDLKGLRSRREADAALVEDVPDPVVRGFLLKNLQEEGGRLSWRLNLPVLQDSFSRIAAWDEEGQVYPGPVLFLRGEKSDYVGDQDFLAARSFFPQAELETVPGAGHWLHADNPDFVVQSIKRFFG